MGHSGSGVGKGRRACYYISGIWYLHQKGRCEMLIGIDDTTKNITTLGTFFFQCLFTFALFSPSCWLVEIWQPSSWEPQGNSWWDSNSISILFQPCHQSVLVSLIAQANHDLLMTSFFLSEYWSSKTLQTFPDFSPPFQTTVSCYVEACSQSNLWSSQFHITID